MADKSKLRGAKLLREAKVNKPKTGISMYTLKDISDVKKSQPDEEVEVDKRETLEFDVDDIDIDIV